MMLPASLCKRQKTSDEGCEVVDCSFDFYLQRRVPKVLLRILLVLLTGALILRVGRNPCASLIVAADLDVVEALEASTASHLNA